MKNRKMLKTRQLKIKISDNEYTFLRNTAEVYAGGNISKWVRYCFMNYDPKYLKKKGSQKKSPSKE